MVVRTVNTRYTFLTGFEVYGIIIYRHDVYVQQRTIVRRCPPHLVPLLLLVHTLNFSQSLSQR